MKEIREAVEKDAMKFNVSKSFVVSVILAKAYRIADQEPLIVEKKRGPEHEKATHRPLAAARARLSTVAH